MFLDNLAHRFFQLDHVKKHNPHAPENHAAANSESLFGTNDQTAAVFHQKSTNSVYIPNAHVGVNVQLDLRFPYHCQLKSVVDHHELSENLDYDVCWLAAIGLAPTPLSTNLSLVLNLIQSVAVSPPIQLNHFQVSLQSNTHAELRIQIV